MRVELKLLLAVGIAAAAGMFFAPTESAAIPYCGDGVCHSDATVGAEDCEICPEDCGGPCTICGNGFCAGGSETCETCTADCGQCPDDGDGDGSGDGGGDGGGDDGDGCSGSDRTCLVDEQDSPESASHNAWAACQTGLPSREFRCQYPDPLLGC